MSRHDLRLEGVAHWTRVRGSGFIRYELAGRAPVTLDMARALLGADADADWIEYQDQSAGMLRAALLVDGRLEACLFVARVPELPARAWLGGLFAAPELGPRERATLLAGRAVQAGPDPGPTVCSCFGVGRNTICAAIRAGDLQTPGQVTACLKAGGNCGSCIPEIKSLLHEVRFAAAAAA